MGLVSRYFIVHDDDTVERLAAARFQRLIRRDSDERWPEHAGKRLRYALYLLDQSGDDPSVAHAEFGFLELDGEGRRDRAAFEKDMHDAVNLIGSVICPPASGPNVIGSQAFAQRRFAVEHKWEPSEKILRAIAEAIVASPSRHAKPSPPGPHVRPAPRRHLSLVPGEDGAATVRPRRRVGRSDRNRP